MNEIFTEYDPHTVLPGVPLFYTIASADADQAIAGLDR